MRTVVIGGTGHIGTFLVPRLVAAGHDVTVVCRRKRRPFQPDGRWPAVRFVELDRQAEEAAGRFGPALAELEPQVVIDLICFQRESARQLVEALQARDRARPRNGGVQHLLHCGTMWVHGPAVETPVTEEQPRRPICAYGQAKAAIEAYLLQEARTGGIPCTVLHPGHIVGPCWAPINPAGHLNLNVFAALARGQTLALPNFGLETLHHVHADDVAQAFMQALRYRSAAVGESFHVVSPAALTLRGYAQAVAAWFGQTADLRFLPWEQWRTTVTPEEAALTEDHLRHSPNGSIAKARRLLDYQPRYTSLEAIREAVNWLSANGRLGV